MPTNRVPLLMFSGLNQLTSSVVSALRGLTVTGPATGDSPGFLRRNRGMHESCFNELRPAPGNSILRATTAPVTAIARFQERRYYKAGGSLFVAGTPLFSGMSTHPVTLTRLPPGNTQPEQLFVAGAGLLRKVAANDTVTSWGIEPPPDQMVATLGGLLGKTIEDFNNAADWNVASAPAGATVTDETSITQSGHGIKVTIPANTLVSLFKGHTIDLGLISTAGDSSDEDYIQLWVRVDAANLEYILLQFSLGNGSFTSDYYQFRFVPTNVTSNITPVAGIADSHFQPSIAADESGFIASQAMDSVDGQFDTPPPGGGPGDVGGGASNEEFLVSTSSWSLLRVRKSRFARSGHASLDWSDVAAYQFLIHTAPTDAAVVYIDTMKLLGGAGMWGNYQSLVTFENTVTGARSNSNPTPVSVLQNKRQFILYDDIPVSADSQVNARTLWRTLGNGAAFFREKLIADNTTTTFSSRVADYVGLWSNQQSEVLFLPELPTDNARPSDTFLDFIYDQATVFWLDSAAAKRGRVAFSPAGRPEGNAGFIQVTNGDFPLFRLLIFARARYALGDSGIYRIDGSEPYTSFKFDGVPGVQEAQAYTAVPTPQGIIYQARDGLRIFDGSTSVLLFFDKIGPLFRGESLEQFTAFQGVAAGFARDQYYISDGAQGLAINLQTGLIRDLGQGFTAFHYEEDTKSIVAGVGNSLVLLEEPGTAPSVAQEWETVALYSAPGSTSTLQRLYIDADTRGAPWVCTVIIDGNAKALPPFVLAGRGFIEYPIGSTYFSFAVRLDIPAGSDGRLFQLYADIYTAPTT